MVGSAVDSNDGICFDTTKINKLKFADIFERWTARFLILLKTTHVLLQKYNNKTWGSAD